MASRKEHRWLVFCSSAVVPTVMVEAKAELALKAHRSVAMAATSATNAARGLMELVQGLVMRAGTTFPKEGRGD
jgi:hypothetical protein